MKRIIFLAIIMFTFSIPSVFAQGKKSKIQKDTFQVSGVCNQCKQRIETAAYIPGVRRAEWDKHSKVLTFYYNTKKVKSEDIKQSIANAGHDAGGIKGNDSAYNKLPNCCAYHEVETH